MSNIEINPVTGERRAKQSSQSPAFTPQALTDEELQKLGDMSKEELISLIKRVSGAMWGYALLDDTEKAEAARLKLYNMGMEANEVHKVVPALDKWFDRTQGKAPQSIAMTVESKGIDKLSDDRLLALEREMARVTGQDAIIIPAMPQKLAE